MAKKIKIQYKEITKKSYETDNSQIVFEVIINGKIARGCWRPKFRYISDGVDINELWIEGRGYVRIYAGGGTHKSYEIAAEPTIAEKQPKDLRFTGRTLCIKNLKQVFLSKIKNTIENPGNVFFTVEFKECFGL